MNVLFVIKDHFALSSYNLNKKKLNCRIIYILRNTQCFSLGVSFNHSICSSKKKGKTKKNKKQKFNAVFFHFLIVHTSLCLHKNKEIKNKSKTPSRNHSKDTLIIYLSENEDEYID